MRGKNNITLPMLENRPKYALEGREIRDIHLWFVKEIQARSVGMAGFVIPRAVNTLKVRSLMRERCNSPQN